MNTQATHAQAAQHPFDVAAFELRFPSFYLEGRGLAFPCDAHGQVDLDALSDRARDNYLGARALVGYEYAMPSITPSLH
jgi:hypothetical protein